MGNEFKIVFHYKKIITTTEKVENNLRFLNEVELKQSKHTIVYFLTKSTKTAS